MITSRIFNLGDLKFTVIDGHEKVTVSFGKKELTVFYNDLLELATTLAGGTTAQVVDFKSVEAPRPISAPSRPHRTDVPTLESRTAVSNAPLKQFTREDLAKLDAPIKDPNVRFETVDMRQLASETVRFGS